MTIISRTAALAAITLTLAAAIGGLRPDRASSPQQPGPQARPVPLSAPMIPSRLPAAATATAGHGPIRTVASLNWAGYAVAKPGVKFSGVSATFFVPYLNCHSFPGSPATYSGHWVGLDGFSSRTVEQDGISADCHGTHASYNAWYEVYPKPEIPVPLVMHPGNSITATVWYNAKNREFTMSVRDNSNGHQFTVARRCSASSCARNSAEVISEAPLVNGQQPQLAAYQAVSFANISFKTSTGKSAGVRASYWNAVRIIQAKSTSLLAVPTGLSGAGFVNYWLSPGS